MGDIIISLISQHVILTLLIVAALVMFLLPGKRSFGSPLSGLYGCLTIIALLIFALAAASAVGDYLKANLSPSKLIDLVTPLMPGWMRKPVRAAKNLEEAQKELELSQKLCQQLTFVKNQFLSDPDNKILQSMYCQGQDNPGLPQVKSIADAIARGVNPNVVADPALLNTEQYWGCLNERAFASPVSAANANECKTWLQDPQQWRLCMELAIQLPVDFKNPNLHAPLAPDIVYCRQKVGYQ